MRRSILAFLLAMLAVVGGAPSASAATSVQRIAYHAVVRGCGERITLRGSLLVTYDERALAGGGYFVAVHFQPQGVVGESTSGATYHATGLTRDISINVPAGGFTETTINRFHIVGTAGAPTYSVADTYHITVTAVGGIQTVVDRHSATCQ